MVCSLIAAIKELAGRVEGKAPWIVPPCPDIVDELQRAIGLNRKDADAVVQAIPSVDELAIRTDQDLRAKIASSVSLRQRRDGLPCCEFPRLIVEEHDGRALFLNGIEPLSIRVKRKVPRTITWRQRDGRRFSERQLAELFVKVPDEYLV